MSSDIYVRPDLSKKARYTRKVEDGGEWKEREVAIYQSVDDIEHDPTGFQLQEEETRSEKHPPVQKGAFREATLVLSGLCLLLFAGIIVLITYHISVTLEKDQLKTKVSELKTNTSHQERRYEKLSQNYTKSLDEVKRLNTETRELKTKNSHQERRYETLSQSHTQLQDEVKTLNAKTHELKSNNNQLQDEVKKLNLRIEGKWCPRGWTRFGYSCYSKFTGDWKTWDESRTDCQSKGADLVIINNQEEQDFVRRLSENEESWIGLEKKSQGWRWVDGSPLTVTFWAEGVPRYSNSYAACCNQQGKWTSSYYSSSHWICEK